MHVQLYYKEGEMKEMEMRGNVLAWKRGSQCFGSFEILNWKAIEYEKSKKSKKSSDLFKNWTSDLLRSLKGLKI